MGCSPWSAFYVPIPNQVVVSCATSLVMSHVEIKYYSAAYFEHIATFEVLYRQTSARSRSHTHLLDEAVSAVSLRGALSPSLL